MKALQERILALVLLQDEIFLQHYCACNCSHSLTYKPVMMKTRLGNSETTQAITAALVELCNQLGPQMMQYRISFVNELDFGCDRLIDLGCGPSSAL